MTSYFTAIIYLEHALSIRRKRAILLKPVTKEFFAAKKCIHACRNTLRKVPFIMAVPKKRTSKATKGQRRSHDALTGPQLITEAESGLAVPRRFWKAAKQGLARIGANR